ncbi:Cd2+/Zn2+-exporting ATPase [Arenibacter nanhaiticus]|uniref:P-type Zn(2+) transporter n=1 Tax=Arenibacter nanhaiticus TaxID=558155 RepID=A0A1M6G9T9_9FLAO|nr:heavy metal translocating P-type ATPase [Arenibacter nanhaiticus]SHJ06711.1 Cd2+/Zn2+-exporting ATPase [Arenibacter nanhaiticus]
MEDKHSGNDGHDHNHDGIFGEKTELYYAVLAGIFFVTGLLFKLTTDFPEWTWHYSYYTTYFFGGYFAGLEAFEKIRKGEFEIDFLMIVAALGAAYIGEWGEGALLLFLFSLGHALENHAMGKAKKALRALGDLSPKTAWLKTGEGIKEVSVDALQVKDVIVVKPHSKISADGLIIKGSSSIDEAAITGESMPVDKWAIDDPGNTHDFDTLDKKNIVFSGTINGDTAIEVMVLKLKEDSTLARLIKMVSEVETKKSPTQRLTKKFEKRFVPAVIILVLILCFGYVVLDETIDESLYRAISVLVAASPCALAISTPSAVLSGVARAARGGVLIKGGRALEDLGSLTTIAFDKTGTLTEGKPKLTHVKIFNEFDKKEFLKLVVAVERLSNHPLAKAIVKGIMEQFGTLANGEASNITAVQGKGIKAIYQGGTVFIGNEALMKEQRLVFGEAIMIQKNSLLKKGHTVMLVAYKDEIIGLLSLMDVPRATAKNTLAKLREIGIKRMVMLTGDHQNVGDSIAQEIGLTEAQGNLLPENKVSAIEKLKQTDAKVAMVGDGVNDAPAMAMSTVSIAMGAAGSDVALEIADVALMSDKIEKLPFVIALSRASKNIIKQNLWISMGVVAILIPATIMGWASIGVAVAMHEGSTLVVVFNALRLLRFKDNFK